MGICSWHLSAATLGITVTSVVVVIPVLKGWALVVRVIVPTVVAVEVMGAFLHLVVTRF